ncbi:MAG: bifunctional DNA primase/polymerase [Planctomycetota bacterium]
MSTKPEGTNLLQDALKYLKRGFSVIPIRPKGKKPLISWKAYQKRVPQERKVEEWWNKWPEANIGIVTGEVSGLVVVDVDGEKGLETAKRLGLPETPTVKTGKGYHYYYLHPGNEDVRNFQAKMGVDGIDLRGDGGYAVAPPSVHPSGETYQWVTPLGSTPLTPLPESILAITPSDKTPVGGLVNGVPKGERNNALARLSGSLFAQGWRYTDALRFFINWNAHNEPPLSERELRATVKSIYKTHIRNKRTVSTCSLPESSNCQEQPPFLRASELLEYLETVAPQSWVVDELVAEGCLTVITGQPGVGKSVGVLMMAKCISEGQPFLGRATKKKEVYYFDLEMSARVIRERLTLLKPLDVFYVPKFWLGSFSLYDKTLEGLAEQGSVLILDNASKLAIGKDTNTAQDVTPITARLRELVNKGATVILITHPPKGASDAILGSQAWKAEADCCFLLEKKEGKLMLEVIKNRLGEEFSIPLSLKFSSEGVELKDITQELKTRRRRKEREEMKALRDVMEHLGGTPSQVDLIAACKKSPGWGMNYTIDLLKKGKGRFWKEEDNPHDKRKKQYTPI